MHTSVAWGYMGGAESIGGGFRVEGVWSFIRPGCRISG